MVASAFEHEVPIFEQDNRYEATRVTGPDTGPVGTTMVRYLRFDCLVGAPPKIRAQQAPWLLNMNYYSHHLSPSLLQVQVGIRLPPVGDHACGASNRVDLRCLVAHRSVFCPKRTPAPDSISPVSSADLDDQQRLSQPERSDPVVVHMGWARMGCSTSGLEAWAYHQHHR